jgi:hypothetical protein
MIETIIDRYQKPMRIRNLQWENKGKMREGRYPIN